MSSMSPRLAVFVLILGPTALFAQRRCVKGIPCGGSCIAANKVCRVGAPTPTPTPAAKDTVRPAQPLATPSVAATALVSPVAADSARILPPRVPGAYDSFVEALVPWRSKLVQMRNSSETTSLRGTLLLLEVHPGHLVITNSIARAIIPYSSIEMVHSDKSADARDAVLTIVIRR
jgi:hypothetical protein